MNWLTASLLLFNLNTGLAMPGVEADSVVAVDTVRLIPRTMDAGALEELQKDQELDYRLPPTIAESLWDRIKLFLYSFFEALIRGATETSWGRVVLYAVGLGLLVLLVFMLLKVNAFRVFVSASDVDLPSLRNIEQNIHEVEFDVLIREALDKKEFRLAVRLTFLYALRILSDKEHVRWRPGKTNHEYLTELKDPGLLSGFRELSLYFEYVWYGEFPVDEKMYRRVNAVFESWRSNVP